jgi:hypothetical protein
MHPKRADKPNAKRPRVSDRDMDKLVEACWMHGWWCVEGGKHHVKCYPPNDERMVIIPSTPSGSRTLQNKKAALRRSGLKI